MTSDQPRDLSIPGYLDIRTGASGDVIIPCETFDELRDELLRLRQFNLDFANREREIRARLAEMLPLDVLLDTVTQFPLDTSWREDPGPNDPRVTPRGVEKDPTRE